MDSDPNKPRARSGVLAGQRAGGQAGTGGAAGAIDDDTVAHRTVGGASADPGKDSAAPAADAGDTLIELAGVSYSYPNGLEAVSDISLRIDRGSRLGIVGPSGCGKSTLLRLITELAQPGRGHIVRNYEATQDWAPMAMVFQEDTLLPWLTVRKNVSLYYRMHPGILSRAEIEERVDRLLSMVGLEGFGDMFPRQLSGGMKRRVAFLAAIAPRPQLLLLDEPFSSVDEPTRVEIHQQVRDILDEFKITTILVTHDLAEAISLMDAVAILSARPARVAQLRPVELKDASDLLEARGTGQFLELYGHLWEALSHEIRAARGAGTSAAERSD